MILDLFAGPGGWDVGARDLGIEPLGIEWDDAACATREAAGLLTQQADVAELDPAGFTGVEGLIASPPCQAWSMAGKRGGERDKHEVIACAHEIAAGNDTRSERGGVCEDPRSLLVVEPLRWARDLEPMWLAFEQVPPVLELWSLFAGMLSTWGYRCWAGVLKAERYGVPQTRKRAILMAHRERHPAPPMATHQEYVPGEPARYEHTMEGEVLPWVSMAEALGWGMTARPYPVIASGRSSGGPDKEKVGGAGAREQIYGERAAGRWHYRNGNQENAARRPIEEPAPTLHFGHALNSGVEWTTTPDEPWRARDIEYDARAQTDGRTGEPNRKRQADEPAPTIAGESRNDSWRPGPTHMDPRNSEAAGRRPRPVEEPAPTMLSEALAKGVPVWTSDRPATTVCGRPDVWPPGHKLNADDVKAGRKGNLRSGSASEDGGLPAVRVSLEEAAVLQGFPPDYPFQGTRTKQFEQVGNAVPPPLARAVLVELVDVVAREEAA